jgi:hypothetical protein
MERRETLPGCHMDKVGVEIGFDDHRIAVSPDDGTVHGWAKDAAYLRTKN